MNRLVKMSPAYKKLFWSIMDWGCSPEVRSIYHEIQKQQTKKDIPYQLPEPWNGDLENAKIIFIGINPSFDLNEFFPKNIKLIPHPDLQAFWASYSGFYRNLCGNYFHCAKIEYFFENRFSGSVTSTSLRFVNDELKTLQDDGTYSKNAVAYWKFVRDITNYELITTFNKKRASELGKDCALTELIPCKSKYSVKNNIQLLSNKKTCIEDYIDNIVQPNLNLLLDNKNRLLIIIGREPCEVWYNILKQCYGASYTFESIWQSHTNEMFHIPRTDIKVVFAPHPSHGNNSISKYYNCRSKSTISF